MTRKQTTLSHQELGLLKAIQEDPTNDAVRLVYSDWLEENGRLRRADFVRGQIALAGMTEDSPERRALAFRCRRLLDIHEGRWAESLFDEEDT